jgi:biopolymer transport protein ExbD
MGGGGGGGDGEPEFQIAPMIDVLLTLLIFFMSITSSQVEQLDNDLTLPVAPDAKERKPNPMQAIVNLKWRPADQKSIMTLNKKEYPDPEELQKAMETFVNSREAGKGGRLEGKAELLIRGDQAVPAKDLQKIMQVAGLSGIDTISFSTYNQ